MAIFLAAAFTLNGAVIAPIYISVSNDISFDGTLVPILLEYTIEIIELVAVSIAYAFVAFGVFNFGSRNFSGGVLVFIGLTLYKYALNMIVDWYMGGSIPTSWLLDLTNAVSYTALEAIQLLIVWLIINHFAKKRASGKGGETPALEGEYPFSRCFDMKNSYLRAAFFCALVIVISKAFGRAVNDIYSIVNYGFPEKAATWGMMVLYYVFEAVKGVAGYFVMYLTLSELLGKAVGRNKN